MSLQGVYSFGNGTAYGSNLTDYLRREAPRRDTTVYVIHTDGYQDDAVVAALKWYVGKPLGIPVDNCSSRSNAGLDALGIPGSQIFTNIPGLAGLRARNDGADVYSIPKGSTEIPAALDQFDTPSAGPPRR